MTLSLVSQVKCQIEEGDYLRAPRMLLIVHNLSLLLMRHQGADGVRVLPTYITPWIQVMRYQRWGQRRGWSPHHSMLPTLGEGQMYITCRDDSPKQANHMLGTLLRCADLTLPGPLLCFTFIAAEALTPLSRSHPSATDVLSLSSVCSANQLPVTQVQRLCESKNSSSSDQGFHLPHSKRKL